MIPTVNTDITPDYELVDEPTLTYRLGLDTSRIIGNVDGLTAMEQVVYKILNTERYNNVIYSWDYGVELDDMIGKSRERAYPEIQKRITDALLQDDRITAVSAFVFESVRGAVTTKFTVTTVEGDIDTERTVMV